MTAFDDSVFTQLDILRHGECEGGHIFRGSSDVALSGIGRKRMHKVAAQANVVWDVVITSPLTRCKSFAAEFAEKNSLVLEVEDGLREMHFGDWEGRKIDDIWRDHAQEIQAWGENPEKNSAPNAEALVDVNNRVAKAIERVVTRHRGKKVLVVSHGGVVRVILARVLDMPLANISRFDVPYACISRLLRTESRQSVRTKVLAHNFISVDSV